MNEDKKEKECILLVDDNPTNLQVLFQTLEGLGCKLLIAKSGEMGLSIAAKAHPNLILLDIMMPGIDGFEVCRRLKDDPTTADIPVIFLSALDDTQDKVRGLQLGAVDYVSKPFQPDEVIARVNTHLTINRLRREVQDQRDQLEHELEVVSKVQLGLLPERPPQIDGLKLAVFYETSRYAGGDYYDIIQISDTCWGFLVADAEGHSTPAAVRMAMTCALFRAYPGALIRPNEVLNYLNQHLCKVAENSFITALYVVYDTEQQTLRIARAGHPPPMIYRVSENKAVELACHGVFPMGIDSYDQVPVTETKLERGDRLIMYTDGITERFSNEGKPYKEERLLRQLESNQGDDPQALLHAIRQDVERFAGNRPADDDQIILVIVID
jgi:sigma-B regulation protein RsbU (phosphoserine phosphatase)